VCGSGGTGTNSIAAEVERIQRVGARLARGVEGEPAKSIAHVFQNMWLKATELAFGFMLLSPTGMLSAGKAFMAELGLTRVEWEFDGCLVGTPAKASEPSAEHLSATAVSRLD